MRRTQRMMVLMNGAIPPGFQLQILRPETGTASGSKERLANYRSIDTPCATFVCTSPLMVTFMCPRAWAMVLSVSGCVPV